jgi:hypothetical protein
MTFNHLLEEKKHRSDRKKRLRCEPEKIETEK